MEFIRKLGNPGSRRHSEIPAPHAAGFLRVEDLHPVTEPTCALASKQRLRSSYLWVLGGQLGGQGILWLVSLWVARLLDPQDYGLWAMAALFVSFCRTLQDGGLGGALIQKRTLSQQELSSTFWFLLGTGLSAVILGWLSAPLLGWIFHDARVIPVVRVASCVFVLLAVRTVPYSLLAREFKFASRTKAELLSALGGAFLTLSMAWKGYGVWSLVIGGGLGSEILLTLLLYWYCPWRPHCQWTFSSLSPLLRFGLPFTGAVFLWEIYYQADIFVIGFFLGPTALGFYAMAIRLAMVVSEKIAAVINKVSFPAFSALRENRRAVGEHWLQITQLVGWICFPMLVGLMLVAEPFVHILLTSKWLPIVLLLQILCALAVLRSLEAVMPQLINALGHPDKIFAYNLISAFVLPAGFVAGVLWANAVGVAIAWLAMFPFMFLWILRLTLKLTGVSAKEYAIRILPPALATIIMAITVLLARNVPVSGTAGKLLLHVTVGAATYLTCALLWLWKTNRLSTPLAWLYSDQSKTAN